mmetsp:Transcript_10794/g.26590  ORF Transcript_10794/g.26590 Transcript_10794/m.26590 type:complete len:213 (-) Transcript_10794:379-1017(-)
MAALAMMSLGLSTPRAASTAGVRFHPSMNRLTGSSRQNDRIWMMPNRLTLSIGSSADAPASFLSMSFLDSTLRDWKVRLDPMADRKPFQLKDASLMDAIATPPMMGTREAMTRGWGLSFRNMADRATEKAGSMALMVWVKDTATEPRDTLVSRLPRVCTTARGAMPRSVCMDTLGLFTSPRVQNAMARAPPTINWTVVHVRGNGNTFSTCLL